ncbi:DUF1622 domain-containing protein [Rugosimonospora acidiphila]|uniref:DUF1622 domain-containing protein n=1 Tax=Rugosimonospora acidiphila TaxID=556531 RepID=A0ABP9RRD0_9ACTN
MTFLDLIRRAAQGFDAIGAAVLVLGLVWSMVLAGRMWRVTGGHEAYRALRQLFGAVLLLGLEFFVAADLIRTVAVSPSLRNVAVLGLIVVIRTFLSFSLQVEIDGVVPWHKAVTKSGAAVVGEAARANRPGAGGGSDREV